VWLSWFGLAALFGSIPFGFLVARARGVDVRAVGSGNIGATNVARAIGKPLGLLVLALDAAKGALALLVLAWAGLDGAPRFVAAHALALGGLLAVLGHCFTPWLGFRGGKGVATSLGVLLVWEPRALALALLVFAALFARGRRVSLGSLGAAASLPLTLAWLGHDLGSLGIAAGLVTVVAFQHRENLARLRGGSEPSLE